MAKTIIALNSHSLSDYQRCPMLYHYSVVKNLESVYSKKAFTLGTFWARMMEIYYNAKKDYGPRWKTERTYDYKIKRVVKRLSRCAESETNGFDDDERALLATRIILYHKFYENESWIPIAVETGFTYLLHEDDEYVFIYEGCPDLIVSMPDPIFGHNRVLVVVDHKTRGKNEDLIGYNNQVNGYLMATRSRYFVYNYCGKQQEGGASKYFQRQIETRTDEALNEWKENTIQWYYRLAADLKSQKFLRSMNCSGKYGACQFIKACAADTPLDRGLVLANSFKQREKVRRSW